MLPTLHFAADRGTLGSFRAAGLWLALCWGVALTLILANVLLVTTFVIEWGGMCAAGLSSPALSWAFRDNAAQCPQVGPRRRGPRFALRCTLFLRDLHALEA
jgi:hypothetical protein